MIKTLLIDDEYEFLDDTYDVAKDEGVEITDRCKSLEKAKELLKTPEKYHAIICDANFLEKEEDLEPQEGAFCLVQLHAFLNENRIDLKIFVYSGRVLSPDFKASLKNITALFGPTYNKKKLSGNKSTTRLFQDVKKHYSNLENIKIKARFRKAFEMCSLMGETNEDILLNQIKQMDNNQAINTNKLRSLLDNLYNYCVKKEYAPKGMAPAGVSYFINGDRAFVIVDGRPVYYTIKETQKLPALMSTISKTLWTLTNKDSHGSETRPDLVDKRSHSPYWENNPEKLLSNEYSRKGIIFLLCEYLVFFKSFFDSNLPKRQWDKN